MKYLNYFVFSFCLLFGLNSFAQNADKTKSALFLEQVAFEEKLKGFKKILEEFNVTYEKYLTNLEVELKEKGELKQLLVVRKEKAEFRKRVQVGETKYAKLQQLRSIYSKGREKRRDQFANDLIPVLNAHLVDLVEIRKALTKEDKIDEALIVKKEEEHIKVLLGDPKTAVFTLGIFLDPFNTVKAVTTPAPVTAGQNLMKARAHILAKGEIEIFINGKKLRYRNTSDHPQYIDAITSPLDIGANDIVVIRIRSSFGFRGVIFAFKEESGSRVIPFPTSVYRLLSNDDNVDVEKYDAQTILKTSNPPVIPLNPDPNMVATWKNHDISGSQFAKPVAEGIWSTWGIVIKPDMIYQTESASSKPGELTEDYMVGTEWEYSRLSGESRVLKFEKGKFHIYTKNENGVIESDEIEPWNFISSEKKQIAGFQRTLVMTLNEKLTEMSWGGLTGDAVTAKLINKDFSDLSKNGFEKWLLEQFFDFQGSAGGFTTLKFDKDKVNYGGTLNYDYEVTGNRELEISKTSGNADFKMEFSKDLQTATFNSIAGVYPVRINAKD